MKNRLLIIWLTCIAVITITGCTSPTPAQNQYRLNLQTKAVKAETGKCRQKTLKVERSFGDKLYMSLKMYYVEGKYAQYSYAQSRWAQTPNDALTYAVTEYLRAMNLFKSVQSADSKTKNDYRLEINIEDFMQYFDENEKNSFVNVVITCNLVDEASHKTVATKTFHFKQKTLSDDAKGGVIALSNALDEILKECGLWLQGVCLDK
ncbi:ABC-type transport auxiliary lipoprotein family protein [Sulfurimonas sediminis]|uniref:ABC-type transport auxiliary lipoprotein family protein n=1 Tax=Sulfurimonas sediminis TaxID=2590020 RepID=UPI001865F487|nr:ABC-type transport auxiliary lipoprotein family protein [Sulfurimonas sediminis]